MSDFISRPMKSDRGYLEPEEVGAIIDAASSLRDELLVWLLWATGCRLGELLLLNVEDITWKDKVLHLWTLKRQETFQRPVLVDTGTMDLIKKYMDTYDIRSGPLIRIGRRRVQQIVYSMGVRAGIPNVGNKKLHPHHLRHSHCVAWVRSNPSMESLKKLQQRLGHASINTTAHYLQFAFSEQQSEVDAVIGTILRRCQSNMSQFPLMGTQTPIMGSVQNIQIS